jgi:hypothetical protein
MAIDSKHLTESTRRLACGVLRAFAATSLLYSGCNDDVDSRQRAGAELSEIRFGVDGRLGLTVSPSVIDDASTDTVTGVAVSQVWASAPFVDMELNNGEFSATTFRVLLRNVDGRAVFDASLTALPSTVRRDSRCVTEAFTSQPDVAVAPVEPSQRLRTIVEVEVVVPGCTSLTIHSRPDVSVQRFRMAVAGEVLGDGDALQRAIDAALRADADHIHVLGGVLVSENASALRVAPSDLITFSYSMGATEAQGAWDAVHAAFGPSNWVARIGRVRLVNLDTAGGGLVEEQWRVAEGLDTDIIPGPSVALMQTPPLDATGINESAFRSYVQAARLVELLQRTRARLLFSSNSSRSDREDFSLMELVNIADSRARGSERRIAVVDILQPSSMLLSCGVDSDCRVGESCVEDVCLTSCNTDSSCPATRSVCGALSGVRGCRLACTEDLDCASSGASCLTESGFCTERARYSWLWLNY